MHPTEAARPLDDMRYRLMTGGWNAAARGDGVDLTLETRQAGLVWPRSRRYAGCLLNVGGLQEDSQLAARWLARELGTTVYVVKVTKRGKSRVIVSSHDAA